MIDDGRRLMDDELERVYRTPESITSDQVHPVIVELHERRAADDTVILEPPTAVESFMGGFSANRQRSLASNPPCVKR